MTAVAITYIFQAPEGFHLSTQVSYPVGIVAAVLALGLFLARTRGIAVGSKESPAASEA